MEVAGGGPGLRGVAVTPEDLAARIGDLDDRLVVLLVRDDRRAVVDEEGVVGEVEAPGPAAAAWTAGSGRSR